MFLTEMDLNPARRGTRRLVGSPQVMHAAVLSAFPPSAEDAGRVLWRVDRHGHRLVLYISSPTPPDLTHIIEQAGWPTSSETWRSVDMTSFLTTIESGQRLAFRLTANVVRSFAGQRGTRGRVGPLTIPAEQSAWLLDRCQRLGFAIPDNSMGEPQLEIVERKALRFRRDTGGVERTVTSSQATFVGLLEVADPDALRVTLANGIGRGKAYGCGLLTLAAPQR